MFDLARLKGKLHTARSQFNNMDIADITIALNKISEDEAKAIIEEIQFAKVTVPGIGLVAGSNPVTGTSIGGNLS